MHIVLLGAPGSGKGTQAQRLSTELGMRQLSTGELLRSAVAQKTALGLEVQAAMESGSLVPDEIVLGMIRERLATDGATVDQGSGILSRAVTAIGTRRQQPYGADARHFG